MGASADPDPESDRSDARSSVKGVAARLVGGGGNDGCIWLVDAASEGDAAPAGAVEDAASTGAVPLDVSSSMAMASNSLTSERERGRTFGGGGSGGGGGGTGGGDGGAGGAGGASVVELIVRLPSFAMTRSNAWPMSVWHSVSDGGSGLLSETSRSVLVQSVHASSALPR